MNVDKWTDWIVGAGATVAGVAGWCLGGWDAILTALVAAMAIDYVTGFMVAAIFHNSPKTDGGRLDSQVGAKGLARKFSTILIVALAHMVDKVLGVEIIRAATVIGFLCNEALSICENAGHMGIKIPKALSSAVEELAEENSEQVADRIAEDKREQECYN